MNFVHTTRALRVVLGAGSIEQAGAEAERLGLHRLLVVTTPRRPEPVRQLLQALGPRAAGVFDRAQLHVPSPVAEAAVAEASRREADGLVALGGGSAIGVAKAVALEADLPILALPTTYSGSEMTNVWGRTEEGRKRTGRDDRAAPRVVIYDPILTTSLPPRESARSGLNAMAHAVEALYAADAGPPVRLVAEEGIRVLASALPAIGLDPGDLEARSQALYGASLSGWALDAASMGLHHKLCHVLGGTFSLPHAEVHALLLPHVLAYNAPKALDAQRRVARALGVDDAPGGLFELADRLGVTTSLRSMGLGEEDLVLAAELAVRTPYPNPRAVTRDGVLGILESAWRGGPPGTVGDRPGGG